MLDQPKKYDHHRNWAERSEQARLALRYQITGTQPFTDVSWGSCFSGDGVGSYA